MTSTTRLLKSSLRSTILRPRSNHIAGPTSLPPPPLHQLTPVSPFTTTSPTHSRQEISTDPGITAVSSTGYVAPLKKTVRNIKYFSLSSLALSTLISPVFFIIDSEIEPAVRAIMVGIALGTSALSTAVIQWVLKPYVVAGKHLNAIGNDRVQFHRLSWLGMEKTKEVDTAELTVEKNGRMFSNLKTKDDCFYVHETTQFWRDLTKESSQVQNTKSVKNS